MIRSAKQEADHSPEADTAVPQHRGQRNVADRADEAEQADDRTDDRPPDLRRQRMVDEEEMLPEAVGHPGGDGPGDQKPDHDVSNDRGPLHDEDVGDRRRCAIGAKSMPQAAFSRDRHVHGGVPFHGARPSPCRPGSEPLRSDAAGGRGETPRRSARSRLVRRRTRRP